MATPCAPRRSRAFTTLLLGTAMVGGLSPMAWQGSTAAAQECLNVPASIPADGSVNVWRRLQDFLNRVPDGSCIQFPPQAKYRVERTLRLRNRVGLTIFGNGSKLFATSVRGDLNPGPKKVWRQHLAIQRGSDITVQDLWIEGAAKRCRYSSRTEGEAGVLVKGSADVQLLGLKVTRVAGDGLQIGGNHLPTGEIVPARNVTFSAGYIACTGRQGIAITLADGVVIEDSFLGRAARTAFDLEPDTADETVSNVQIVRNRIARFPHAFIGAGGAGTVRDVYVGFNVLTRRSLWSKIGTSTLMPRGNFTFEGNISEVPFDRSGQALLNLRNAPNFIFRSNTQTFHSGEDKGEELFYALWGDPTTCPVNAGNNILTGAAGVFDPIASLNPICWVDEGGNQY
jgi:hypothetical protein